MKKFVFLLMILIHSVVFAAEKAGVYITSEIIPPITAKEKAAITENAILTVAVTEYPPFVYTDPVTKKLTGTSIELLDIISHKTGLQFNFKMYSALYSAHNAVKRGEADLAFIASEHDAELLRLSVSYATRKLKIIVTQRNKNTWTDVFEETVLQKKDIPIVQIKGTYVDKIFKDINIDVAPVFVNSVPEALMKIIFDEGAFVLLDTSQFGYYASKMGFSRLAVANKSQIFSTETKFGFNKNLNNYIATVFDKTIASLNSKELEYVASFQSKFEYNEPVFRAEFGLLMGILIFIFINNIIWYIVYVFSIRRVRNTLDARWCEAVSTSISQNGEEKQPQK